MKSTCFALLAALAVAAPVDVESNSNGMFFINANGNLGYTGPAPPAYAGPKHRPKPSTTSTTSSVPTLTTTATSTIVIPTTIVTLPALTTSSPPVTTTAASSSSVGSPVVDDYPSALKNACNSVDYWSLNACQCVSFVAWRISQRLDKDFSRSFDSETWGNANSWDDAARAAGFTVDNNPTVGSIAQTDAGEWGHVAWVYAVDGDDVWIEEYNAMNSLAYDTRSISRSSSGFVYIHIPKE